MSPKSAIFDNIISSICRNEKKDIDETSQISCVLNIPKKCQAEKIKNKKFREEAACSRQAVRRGGYAGV